MALEIGIGSWIEIDGLVGASKYNGSVAIVVANKDSENERWGVQLLDHGVGWEQNPNMLKFGGKQIAVKESNMKRCTSGDSKHWRIKAMQTKDNEDVPSLLEIVLSSPHLKTEQYCDIFCEKVWNIFFETIPGEPLQIEGNFNLRKELIHAKGHKLYWISLSAIQHYMIIEKCASRYRLFHTYVKTMPGAGFTAEQWCTLDHKTLPNNKLHKQCGGGLTLGDKDINAFFDAILEFQKLLKSPSMIQILLEQVPGIANPEHAARLLSSKKPEELSSTEVELATKALELAQAWSNKVDNRIGSLGINQFDVHADPVVISQGPDVLFSIPQKLYERVAKLNEMLTGEIHLSPVVFVRMANSGLWYDYRQNPEDGGAVGFTIRGASLDDTMSEKEGIDSAKAKASNVRKNIAQGSYC